MRSCFSLNYRANERPDYLNISIRKLTFQSKHMAALKVMLLSRPLHAVCGSKLTKTTPKSPNRIIRVVKAILGATMTAAAAAVVDAGPSSFQKTTRPVVPLERRRPHPPRFPGQPQLQPPLHHCVKIYMAAAGGGGSGGGGCCCCWRSTKREQGHRRTTTESMLLPRTL